MNFGGVDPVLSNGMHDAMFSAGLAGDSLAICNYLLSDCDVNQLMPWSHSIWDEPTFLYPFNAVLRAQSLSLSVYKDETECKLGLLQAFSESPTGSLDPTDFASDLPKRGCDFLSRCNRSLKSCFLSSRSSGTDVKRGIRFRDSIDLYIGIDQEINMQHISVEVNAFSRWSADPWQIRLSPTDVLAPDADPLSRWAVSISGGKELNSDGRTPTAIQARLTDEHDSIPSRIAQESREPAHADRPAGWPLQPPAFVTDLFSLPGFLALPPNFLFENGITVRTWYLHHEHFPRWRVPRFVELDHNWGRWQSEFASAWRDMIIRTEAVNIFIVMPDPDRSYVPRQILADVIIAQGTEAGRYAGLLSVHQQTSIGHRRPFAVAVSLPDEVSGVGLAQAADIAHLCHAEVCSFYFRWQHIPFSLVPAHFMLDGHGFALHITPRVRRSTARSSEGASGSLHEPASTNQNAVPTTGHPAQEHDYEDGGSEHTTDTSIPGSLAQFEQWQGVQIYRLGRSVVHCFLRWDTYNSILHDIARFLREHLRNLVGIHHVQAVLAGQHEAEDSIILQYVNDLTLGSTEQLVILDVEVHFQPLPDNMLRSPEVSRRVHRVVPQLSRQHVLRLARLANYCFLQGDRCLVYLNNVLWHEQDSRVHSVQHGCYLKVVATPPVDMSVSTDVALGFALMVDDTETAQTQDCTSRPRQHNSLSLVQAHARAGSTCRDTDSCSPGFDRDHHPLHLHVHRYPLPSDEEGVSSAWWRQLTDLFSLNGFVECVEEGPVAYITTWFINHQSAQRCAQSRSVRLIGSDALLWKQQILDAWIDLLDPTEVTAISIVSPTPPGTETESTLAHVMLEQHCMPLTHSAGVISVIRTERLHAYVYHVAISASRLVTLRYILHQVQLLDLCNLRRCQVALGTLLFLKHGIEELHSGFGLVVSVSAPHVHEPTHRYRQLWSPAIAAAMEANSRPEFDHDDHVAFFQVPISNSTRSGMHASPRVCKPGAVEATRDLPITMLSGHLPRPRRPLHDGAEDWIRPLHEIAITHGVLDVWEDEILFVATTWYIHHDRRTACRRPREVQLNNQPLLWIEDLRRAWFDVMDARIPFSIHIVRPRPPQFRAHHSVCHVILEQGRREHKAAVVLTALLEGPANDGIIQGAFSVGALVTLQDAVNTLEIARFCVDRRCSLVAEGREVPERLQVAVGSGDSLRVRVESPVSEDDPTEQLHFEDLSLMQSQTQSFAFNPSAPEFRPGLHCLSLQTEFVQTLHSLWIQDAFAWEQETPATRVLTWFVDHRYPFPKCVNPRAVVLFDDLDSWEQRIRDAWSEMIHSELTLELHVVSPQPHRMERGTAAHVLLVQAPVAEWSTTLVSVCDPLSVTDLWRIAVTTPEHIMYNHIVNAVFPDGFGCGQALSRQCSLWYERFKFHLGHAYPYGTGSSLLLIVESAQASPNEEHDEESVLQLHLQSKGGPQVPEVSPRRLTAGQVAHTQRPPDTVALVVWRVATDSPTCSIPRRKWISMDHDKRSCILALWESDLCTAAPLLFQVQSPMSEPADASCWIIVEGQVDKQKAVLIESVVEHSQRRWTESVAMLISEQASMLELWSSYQMQPTSKLPTCCNIFVQGDLTGPEVHLCLEHGWCITFWLNQLQLASCSTAVDFTRVFATFDWLDSHMFLPCYALPLTFPFLPASLEWTRDWWSPGTAGLQIRLYYDGSRVRNDHGAGAGAAVAAFIRTHHGWQFAGALSTKLPSASTSYQAELAAAIIAHKFAFDLAKLLSMVHAPFEIEFCYDSLSVGKQADGTWQAASATVQGHLLRSLHRCIESRFSGPLHHHHVRAHEGEPGNELVDCLAKQAALGEPLHDLEDWLEFVSRRDFVNSAEWWWFLFRPDVCWRGTELLLPAAPTSCPLDDIDTAPFIVVDNQTPAHNIEAGTLQLCLATCNVLSLMPGKSDLVSQGLSGPSRLDALLTQLQEAHVGIFAFQETRLRRMSHGHDSRYWLFKSSATKHGH